MKSVSVNFIKKETLKDRISQRLITTGFTTLWLGIAFMGGEIIGELLKIIGK